MNKSQTHRPHSLSRIISGGQTGADRAALDFAIEHEICHGGWCPLGRRAEDGTIPPEYRLTETERRNYAYRTERNVVRSDATAVFSRGSSVGGGTALTLRLACRHGKPLLHLHQGRSIADNARRLKEFLADHDVRVLNIAGPRASQEPGIGEFVRQVLELSLLA